MNLLDTDKGEKKYVKRYVKFYKKIYPKADKIEIEHSIQYLTNILPIFKGTDKEIKQKIVAYSSVFPELQLFKINVRRYRLRDNNCLLFYSIRIMSEILKCVDITSQKYYIPYRKFDPSPDSHQIYVRRKIVHIFGEYSLRLSQMLKMPLRSNQVKLIGELPHDVKNYEIWKERYKNKIENMKENDVLFQILSVKTPNNHTNFFVFRKSDEGLESILYDPHGTNRHEKLTEESKGILEDYMKLNSTERKAVETKFFLQKKIQDRLGYCTHISLYVMFILITYLSIQEEKDIFSLLVRIDDFIYNTVIKKMKFIYTTDTQFISDFFSFLFVDFIEKLESLLKIH